MSWHTYAHPHPKRSSKWTHKPPKTRLNFLNTRTFQLNFQDEVQLCPNCLFYILSFCFKCFFFSVLKSWHTYPHSSHNRCSKWTHKSPKKWSYLAKKPFFWGFISEMKVMPTLCLIFWLFILNVIFFSSLVVAYVCIFPS